MYDPNKPLTVIRQTSNPRVDIVANPMYVPPEPVVTPTVTTPNLGMTVGNSINPQTRTLGQSTPTYAAFNGLQPNQLGSVASLSSPQVPAVYRTNQAVVTPEVINTTSPSTAPTTYPTKVGEQIGIGKGMRQAYIRGGAKGAAQFALERAADNVGKTVGTTKANFKAQSFSEKFNTVGSTIGSIMDALNARKQLKLYRQALDHQMAINNKNYDMARKQWNHLLEDKTRYREAMAKDQGRSYETVGEVMAKYGA